MLLRAFSRQLGNEWAVRENIIVTPVEPQTYKCVERISGVISRGTPLPSTMAWASSRIRRFGRDLSTGIHHCLKYTYARIKPMDIYSTNPMPQSSMTSEQHRLLNLLMIVVAAAIIIGVLYWWTASVTNQPQPATVYRQDPLHEQTVLSAEQSQQKAQAIANTSSAQVNLSVTDQNSKAELIQAQEALK